MLKLHFKISNNIHTCTDLVQYMQTQAHWQVPTDACEHLEGFTGQWRNNEKMSTPEPQTRWNEADLRRGLTTVPASLFLTAWMHSKDKQLRTLSHFFVAYSFSLSFIPGLNKVQWGIRLPVLNYSLYFKIECVRGVFPKLGWECYSWKIEGLLSQ